MKYNKKGAAGRFLCAARHCFT